MSTYPEDTNSVVRTVGRAVRLDHTEHTVELPVDEEDNEEVSSRKKKKRTASRKGKERAME